MRTLLKKHGLLVLVCLAVVYSFAAVGGTITRPYGPSDYAGGTRAVGSKINTEFDTIVNWLNGGNISSQNIAALGVATSNIANEAVTPQKIAPKQVARAGLTITSTSTTVATTISDMATLTGTLGRAAVVGLNATSIGGSIKVSSATIANPTATFEIWRDGSKISTQTFGISKNAGETNFSITIPPAALMRIDSAVATGTRNYFIKAYVNDPAVTLTLESGTEVYAYEL